MPTAPTLLISWSHSEPDWVRLPERDRLERERRDAVLRLANNLRSSGIDAQLDLHQSGGTADWSRWGPDKIASSDFVLIIGSPAWNRAWQGNGDPTRGAGAAAEADALRSLYNRNRRAFLAKVRIAFLPGTPTDLPLGLDGIERYYLADETPAALSKLIRDLSNQPAFPPGPLGTLPDLPPDDSWRDGAGSSTPDTHHPAPTQNGPGELRYRALSEPVQLRWRDDWPRSSSSEPQITVHVVPVPGQPIPVRRLAALSTTLAGRLRATGLFDDAEALSVHDDTDGVTVAAAADQRYLRHLRPGKAQGVRVDRSGQVSAWHSLPADHIGSALDEPSAAEAIRNCLTIIGTSGVAHDANVALAVEVSPTSMLSRVDVSTLGHRSTARMQSFGPSVVRVEPDELVEARSLGNAIEEAAQTLADLLLRSWGQRG